MKRAIVIFCAACAIAVALPVSSRAQLPPVRERLGVRSGYIHTLGELDEHYGSGGHLTLHFTERLFNTVYFDFRVAAMYLGDSKHPEVARELTRIQTVVSEMRILFFSVGPQYTFDLSEYWKAYASAGIGVYSVSILFDSGIQAFDTSDQHVGYNAGGGILWRFTDTWNLDLNFTLHHFNSDNDRSDLYWLYTGQGDSSPFLLQFAAGVCIDFN